MKTYKKKIVKAIDNVYCDACSKNCSQDKVDHEYGILEANWGYSSNQDGTSYEIHLCETCFMEIVESLKKKRKSILRCFVYPYDYDPLEGKSYL